MDLKELHGAPRKDPKRVETCNKAVLDLAEYLTGRMSAQMSVAIGGMGRASALRYFQLRDAFGVHGWMSRDEAVAAIARKLELNKG